MSSLKARVSQGAGAELEKKISKSAKPLFIAWNVKFDQPDYAIRQLCARGYTAFLVLTFVRSGKCR